MAGVVCATRLRRHSEVMAMMHIVLVDSCEDVMRKVYNDASREWIKCLASKM